MKGLVGNEKLPTELGWVRKKIPISSDDVGRLQNVVEDYLNLLTEPRVSDTKRNVGLPDI
jgi:hypothetical protein